jgi:hypothetical protein
VTERSEAFAIAASTFTFARPGSGGSRLDDDAGSPPPLLPLSWLGHHELF